MHVADDGGLLAIESWSGRSAWVPEAELRQCLAALQTHGGSILLSYESVTPIAAQSLRLIEDSGLPITASPEVHPDAFRPGGATTLMTAAFVGDLALVSDLLKRGADLAAGDNDGFTALMYAANAGYEPVVSALLAAGAHTEQGGVLSSCYQKFGIGQGDPSGCSSTGERWSHDRARSIRGDAFAGADRHPRPGGVGLPTVGDGRGASRGDHSGASLWRHVVTAMVMSRWRCVKG